MDNSLSFIDDISININSIDNELSNNDIIHDSSSTNLYFSFNVNDTNKMNNINIDDANKDTNIKILVKDIDYISDSHSEPSDSGSSDKSISDDENANDISISNTRKYKKLSFNYVKQNHNKYYDQDMIHKISSSLDILATFLKGQKHIYMEAQHTSTNQLNYLMLPAIFLSALCSVLSQVSQEYLFNGIILASINAITAFLLAIINYLKLDAQSEAHKTSSHQYDSLLTNIEFESGQVLLFSNPILTQQYCKEKIDERMEIYNKHKNNMNSNEYNNYLQKIMCEIYENKQKEEQELFQKIQKIVRST